MNPWVQCGMRDLWLTPYVICKKKRGETGNALGTRTEKGGAERAHKYLAPSARPEAPLQRFSLAMGPFEHFKLSVFKKGIQDV